MSFVEVLISNNPIDFLPLFNSQEDVICTKINKQALNGLGRTTLNKKKEVICSL